MKTDFAIDYSSLLTTIEQLHPKWAAMLPAQIAAGLSTERFGDLPKWLNALNQLPDLSPEYRQFGDRVTIGRAGELDSQMEQRIVRCFQELIPWRKGPYEIYGTHIDTEWRSDWKWQRLIQQIAPLHNRTVLDVGCGNGYHMWRMLEAQAQRVIGIDPSPRFVVQFYMLKHFTKDSPADLLPLGIEALPENLNLFDTTFSMGVLYHRRSPMDHLIELRETLRSGGELVLETLVIEGSQGECLVPLGRYAKMNNVWFLPSVETLNGWLSKCGFENIRCVDSCPTTIEEQRSTEWMQFQSLQDFLNPEDSSRTIEGHPAPLRAIFVANKKK